MKVVWALNKQYIHQHVWPPLPPLLHNPNSHQHAPLPSPTHPEPFAPQSKSHSSVSSYVFIYLVNNLTDGQRDFTAKQVNISKSLPTAFVTRDRNRDFKAKQVNISKSLPTHCICNQRDRNRDFKAKQVNISKSLPTAFVIKET